ncbi:hypothetical protein EMIT07CA2_90008 [Brevibacillus sp. IT-7CA2]
MADACGLGDILEIYLGYARNTAGRRSEIEKRSPKEEQKRLWAAILRGKDKGSEGVRSYGENDERCLGLSEKRSQ